MKIYTFIFLLVLAANQFGLAQTSSNKTYPEIGRAMPNFTLNNVSDYGSKTMTLTDFKGKHVILFFWSKYCANCINALPVVDALQREFKPNLNFFIIGYEDNKGTNQPVFERARKKFKLDIPYAFDSAFFKSTVPRITPHLIWLDNEGIIKAITATAELSELKVENFLNGEPFEFIDRSYSAQEKPDDFDFRKPYLIDGNLGADDEYFFRSVLIKPTTDMPFAGLPESIDWFVSSYELEKGLFQGCGTLEQLYLLAYAGYRWWTYGHPLYGKLYPAPLLQMNDTSDFQSDIASRQGYFCYSLSLPKEKATAEQMMMAMQRDLANYFGYSARIEKKQLPVWKLYATEEATKLKSTRRDRSEDYFSWLGVKFTNISMADFIQRVFNKHFIGKPAILDETKIDFNIDVELEANLLDMNDLQMQLKKLGLILTQDNEVQDAVVIYDHGTSSH